MGWNRKSRLMAASSSCVGTALKPVGLDMALPGGRGQVTVRMGGEAGEWRSRSRGRDRRADPVHRLEQLRWADWLVQIGVHAQGFGVGPLVVAVVTGEHNDRDRRTVMVSQPF